MSGERTTEELLALGNLHPEFGEHLKQYPAPVRADLSVETLRNGMDKWRQSVLALPVPEGMHEEDKAVPARDGHQIPVHIHRPADRGVRGPLVVMSHGGGYIVGGPWQEYLTCRGFVSEFGAVVVNVDYRLAPEHPFPVALYDVFDVLKWAASHAEELGADPAKGFILGGTSAGGVMTNVCAHMARDMGLSPPLTGLYLCIPQVIATGAPPDKYKDSYLSWEQNKDAPLFNRAFIMKVQESYKPDRSSDLYDAIRLDHKGLPRCYFQVCGMDPYRDDALIYEHMLRTEAGVETKIDVYPGVPHGFWVYGPKLDISKQLLADIPKGMAWLLRKGD